MLDVSKYYLHTGIEYNKAEQLTNFINNEAIWAWEPNFYVCQNFKLESIAKLFNDEFLNSAINEFGGFLSLYKIPARCMYHWHRDGRQMWGIQMVLDNFNSYTLFEDRTENEGRLRYVNELVYKPREWVIFNTQELHAVINLDHRDRILITYRLKAETPNKRSYQEVVKWFNETYKS